MKEDLSVTRSELGAKTAGTHTQEPWILVPQSDGSAMIAREFETGKQMNPKGLRLIAHALARRDSLKEDEANARRIVACVNACAGIPDDVLPMVGKELDAYLKQRDELAAALRDVLRIAKAASIGVTGNAKRIESAEAALAKL